MSVKRGILNSLQLRSEDDALPRADGGPIGSNPQASPRHDGADLVIGPSRHLGGCADPALIAANKEECVRKLVY